MPESRRDGDPINQPNPNPEQQDVNPGQEVPTMQEETEVDVSLLSVESAIMNEQRRLFEEDPSFRDFTRLQEGDQLWRHVRPIALTFLKAFSDPPYYVPKDGRKASPYVRKILFDRAPLRAKYFPDSLFLRLGGTLEHKKTTPEGLKERESHFSELRSLFAALKTLTHSKISTQRRRESTRIFVVPGSHGPRGSLIVSRRPLFKTGERTEVSYFDNLYSAERSHRRTLNTYLGEVLKVDQDLKPELEILKHIRIKIQELIAFLQNWNYSNTREREEAKNLIQELEDMLNWDTDLYKVEAREQFLAAKNLTSRDGKINPGSSSARLVAAFNRIFARTARVLNIIPSVNKDLELLNMIRWEHEDALRRASMDLMFLSDDPYFKPFKPDNGGRTRLKKRAGEINKRLFNTQNGNGIMKHLHEISEDSYAPAPFPAWAEAVASNMRVVYGLNKLIAEDKVPADKIPQVHKKILVYLMRARVALKYQHVQMEFVDMLDKILSGKLSRLSDVEAKVKELRKNLDPHSYGAEFRDHKDLVFTEESFTEMSLYLKGILDAAKKYDAEIQKLVKDKYEFSLKLDRGLQVEGREDVDDSDIQKLVDFEDRINEAKAKYMDEIYVLLKECDFKKCIQTSTVDHRSVLDEIKLENEIMV